MGSSHLSEKSLLYTSTVKTKFRFYCFKDYTYPPQFQDIAVIRHASGKSELQNAQIKENFRRLLESINEVMEEEYELKDRKSFNKKLNIIQPTYALLFLAFFVVFFVIFIGSHLSLILGKMGDGRWLLQAIIALFIIPIFSFLLSFMSFVTESLSGKKKMDKRLILKIDSLVKKWNSSYEEGSVFAVQIQVMKKIVFLLYMYQGGKEARIVEVEFLSV